jgi:UDP-N-acetylglucosamine:LPS N-acetylglucosamine transferase
MPTVRAVRRREQQRPRVVPRHGRVLILSATVGQGHEGAARELSRRLRQRGIEVEVRDFLDALPLVARRVLQDGYQPVVQHTPWFFDWLFAGLEHRRWLHRVAEVLCRAAEPAVRRWSHDADVVVSTYPLASQTLGRLRRQRTLTAPAVTFLTDPAAHRLWCHPDVDEHLTVTSATADDGARYGVACRPAGALCAPRFSRRVSRGTRLRLRARLGLPATAPVVLLSAGSLGMGSVPETVDAVLQHPEAWTVVLCGRNARLRRRLTGRRRVVALGWRDDVPELMSVADVLVHNAGGLSFTEALVAGLPAVTYLPIAGHGRANADLLARAALAPWPRDPAELVAAIDDVLDRPRLVPDRRAAEVADPAAVVAVLTARRPAPDPPATRSASA